MIDVKKLLEAGTERIELYSKYVNRGAVDFFRSVDYLRVFVRGEGQYLFDADGNRYLDMMAGLGVHALGRNHPDVRAALHAALDAFTPSLVHLDCPAFAGKLAKELLGLAPDGLARVFFANSGAESIECAIKSARRVTGRSRVVYCDGAFHGLTTGALSLNADRPEFRTGYGPLIDSAKVPYNDSGALESALAKGDVAAFVVEAVQGKSILVADDDYLRRASELCHAHGALLVIDEVQTGLGRTGKWFACEYAGVRPDMLTVSKILSGGAVPVSACLMTESVYDGAFPKDLWWTHSSTFRQNDLAMIAGLATLEVIREQNMLERVIKIGGYLESSVRQLAKESRWVTGIRGRGLMHAVELSVPRERVHELVIGPLFREHRILMQAADWIKLSPSFVITEEDVDYFCGALRDVVSALD